MNKQRILITTSLRGESEAADILEASGIEVIRFPAFKISVIDNAFNEFDFSILQKSDYVIFTSVNSVNSFFYLINKVGIKLPEGITTAAIGEKTGKAMLSFNIMPDYYPEKAISFSMADLFRTLSVSGKRVLYPCSDIADNSLEDEITSLGGTFIKLPVYSNTIPEAVEIKEFIQKIKANKPDVFAFTSPSAFKNFLKLIEISNPSKYFNGCTIAAMGKITESVITEYGIKSAIVPDNPSASALAEGILGSNM